VISYGTHAASLTAVVEADRIPTVNTLTRQAERNFIDPQGLPLRPYFRHILQAPGTFLGYGSQVFPGLSEALQLQNWTLAQQQANVLAGVLTKAGAALQLPTPEEPGGLSGWAEFLIVLLVFAALGGGCFLHQHYRARRKGYHAILDK